jgi:hypothetical protein
MGHTLTKGVAESWTGGIKKRRRRKRIFRNLGAGFKPDVNPGFSRRVSPKMD